MNTFYVIRHKPSGTLLPAQVPSTKFDFDRPAGAHAPRLFKSERAAKNCATLWSQGVWSIGQAWESEGWEYSSHRVDTLPEPSSVPGRRREDLEVVEVHLEFVS